MAEAAGPPPSHGHRATALSIAILGVHATMALTIQQRRRELGIRAALGAAPRELASLLAWQSLRFLGVWILAGVGASLLTGHVLASLVFGARDVYAVATMSGIAVGALAVASLAVRIRRASRVSPIVVLRRSE